MGVADRVARPGGSEADPGAQPLPGPGGAPVRVDGLTHSYPGPDGADVTVLHDLDLDVAAGEHVAISGRSGAGKTTLLGLLGGLEPPTRGRILVGGVDVGTLDRDALASYRSSTVGFVFQHFGLLDGLTALENVELPMTVAGVPARHRRPRARALLDRVGLADRAGHLPGALSGGERQRVAIARALTNEPRLILADEPSGNLDDASTAVVLDLLDDLARDHGFTLLVATHDPAVTSRADRCLHLGAGRLTRP
jgi:putative ABC transport system ATP-binding protein